VQVSTLPGNFGHSCMKQHSVGQQGKKLRRAYELSPGMEMEAADPCLGQAERAFLFYTQLVFYSI